MSAERKIRRKVVNYKEADFETYSLQGKPQADLSWHNISWSDEDDSGFFLIKFDPGGGAAASSGPGLAGNGSANRAARVFDEARGAFFALEEARLLDALNALNALDARAGDLGSEDAENKALSAALPLRLNEAELGDLDDGEAGEAGAELVSGGWSLGKGLANGLSVDWEGDFSGFALRR